MHRSGIIAAGNFILDTVKIIDIWPAQDSLCNILAQEASNGGGPYNVLKDLAKMQVPFPLEALGCVGYDAAGAHILADLQKNNIVTERLFQTEQAPTSYTDVMTVNGTGRRTFFHNRGANALLNVQHFAGLENSTKKILHYAYLMLLDALDAVHPESGRTGASMVLEKAKNLGFITTADVVSENSGKFKETVAGALPFIDYFFVNEFEAGKITEVFIRQDTPAHTWHDAEKACKKLIAMGVNQWVILHMPSGAMACSTQGEVLMQPSLQLPEGFIAGTVGAGDAFAAGVLYGIHEGWHMAKSLQLAVCTAAACLSMATCSDGLRPVDECLYLYTQFGNPSA